MNSSHKPLFVYSYDPPSPDVISEYDPPYPLEIATTPLSDNDLFHFPNIELDNSITVYRNYSSLCKFSQSKTDVELNNVPINSFDVADTRSRDVEDIIYANGDCNMDDGAAPNFTSLRTEISDLNNVNDMIKEEKQNVHEFGVPSNKYIHSLDLINFEISSNTSLDTDNETESALFIPAATRDNNTVGLSREIDDVPLHLSSRSSIESLENSKLNDVYMLDPNDESCSLTLTSSDVSETYYPSDIVTEDARYMSPESTSQSLSSLLTDTITINVPCDSPSPGGESNIFDFSDNKENSGVVKNVCSIEAGTNDRRDQRNSLSSSLADCDGDSLLFSSSPVVSPPLTDSCTITPFPTDFPTPYSTNPTSSPLPADFINQQSESSSSTPSTVTSSTMFCVSRKLENLTTNLSANDLASNNENCSMDANINNEAENAVSSDMHDKSFSCLQNNLVSDTTDNTIENMVFKVGKKKSSDPLSDKDELECNDNATQNYRKIETTNVSELKKKYLESISESSQLNKPKNELKIDDVVLNTKIQEENKKQECRNEMPPKEFECFKNEPEVKSDNRGLPPPPPPPRSDSTQKQIPPPLPPPPNEESDVEDAPPVPSLPLYFISGNISPFPPNPPVRQYLLIPLTPGRTTPILLTPPPAAPLRSSSYRKSPPPPPPIPPKPKLCNSDVDLKNDKKCLARCNEHTLLQNNRYLPLIRELTPVPEEVTSPTRQSPPCFSPLRNDSSNLPQEKTFVKTICEENMQTSTKVQRDLTVPSTRSSSVSDGKHIRPSPSPPPPLPPKPSGLKPLLALKTPPPPPPVRTESLPGTPGTPDSCKSGSRLSPCRLKDRSPPNDRKFTLTADSEREPSLVHMPVSSSGSSNVPPPAPAAPISKNKTSCMTVSPYGKLVINRADLPLPLPEEEIRKVYANVKNWGWIDHCVDTLAIYTQFRPVIQQGPMCGLVALGMASQACPSSVSSEELLQKAKDRGISRHGEMFSAKNMSSLANEVLTSVKATVRKDVLTSSLSVIRILLDGDYILLPYDAEPNHFPGLKKGHKAHWGLLCGCLIQNKALTFCSQTSPFKPDPKTDKLWHLRPVTQSSCNERSTSVPPPRAPMDQKLRVSRSVSPYQISKEDKSNLEVLTTNKLGYRNGILNEADFNVICLYRQGKSRNLIYAPLKDIYESNAQIIEYPTTEDYVIDSVEEGLSRQVVVLHKEIPGLSDLLGTLQEEEKI